MVFGPEFFRVTEIFQPVGTASVLMETSRSSVEIYELASPLIQREADTATAIETAASMTVEITGLRALLFVLMLSDNPLATRHY